MDFVTMTLQAYLQLYLCKVDMACSWTLTLGGHRLSVDMDFRLILIAVKLTLQTYNFIYTI